MERILVTGSSGFIGMHLCKNLLESGYKVLGVDNMNDFYEVIEDDTRFEKTIVDKARTK